MAEGCSLKKSCMNLKITLIKKNVMSDIKEIIKLSIIGFIALVVMGVMMSFYSCGSHKSATKKETLVQREDSIRKGIDFGFTNKQDISNFLRSATNSKISWRLYDTNKPKDPDTGKHPLLAEGDTEESNETEQNINITAADSAFLKSDSASFSWLRENDKQETQTQRNETTVPEQISSMIWASCVLLMIVVWIIYKLKKGG